MIPRSSRVPSTRCRSGSALLEVMLAVVLLATSGTALITLLGQSAHSLRRVRQTELEAQRASDELGRFVTYDRTQILASVGQSVSRGWLVSVAQSAPELFEVVIADTITRVAILRTTVYRPAMSDVATR